MANVHERADVVGGLGASGGQKESQKNRFGEAELRPTAAALIATITHNRITTTPYSTPSSALIIPWSCVRITPGLVCFRFGISRTDGSFGGAASAPPEEAVLAKLLANGPANTRCRMSSRATLAIGTGSIYGSRPTRGMSSRGSHCGRQDRGTTPVGLRSVPVGGSGGRVFATGMG